MTEVTAVPLRPIKKGVVTRLWIGVAAAVLVAGGLAWAGTAKTVAAGEVCKSSYFAKGGSTTRVSRLASGLALQTLKPGQGTGPAADDFVIINYKGTLTDGTVFDQAEHAPLELAAVVPGFRDGIRQMQRGGSYRLCIPPAMGYGSEANGPIPASSTLLFDIDLLDFRSAAEVRAMRMQMQAMQQQGQMPGGAVPGGAPHP